MQDGSYSNRAWAKLAGFPPGEPGRCERTLGQAQAAANSPRGILRTAQVIKAFKQAPAPHGGLSPIPQYFDILEKGELNHLESVELARPLLPEQGRKQSLENG
ncbi:hypothetical protein A0H81_12285 [Grifola frondosa]|uniref:Uncharacterized protein n=1 Tax=Grifola frondosa TaxID=5627 RepID=A0A1C7LU35_GRIFR|nr:hypothetical protein A0H81_12285 [Grifola frondosa]